MRYAVAGVGKLITGRLVAQVYNKIETSDGDIRVGIKHLGVTKYKVFSSQINTGQTTDM